MSWNYELLVRQRQEELQREAARQRLAAEARRAGQGWHLLAVARRAATQVAAVARLRRRLA